jgi:hypothetical protein
MKMITTDIKEKNKISFVRYQVLTAENMKITALWDMAPCCVVEASEVRTTLIIRTISHRPDK